MPRKANSSQTSQDADAASGFPTTGRKDRSFRRVKLSTVISEVMAAGLRLEDARHRRDRILDDCRKAFTGFTAEELTTLDGVILEPVSAGRRR